MSLKKKTILGIFWTGAAKMGMQGVQIIVLFVLARLLSKTDMGVANLAVLVTTAVTIINETGLGTAIVLHQDLNRNHLSSIFWGGMGFGIALFAFFALASQPISVLLHNASVAGILIVLSIGFIIGALAVVPRALLAKEMNFKRLSMIEMTAALLSGCVAVALAFLGFGPWSLVFSIVARDMVIAVLVWLSSSWRPQFHFQWQEFRGLMGFSAKVLANDVALYVNMNSDISLVSRYLGAEAVASYGLLLNIVKTPVSRLSQIVSKVAFPAFASVQDDIATFRKGYMQAIACISTLTFPLLVGLGVFARECILLVLSSKYEDMVIPLTILIPYAMLKSVVTIKGSVLIARRRLNIELAWNVIYLLPFAAAIFFGTHYGLIGVTIAFSGLYLLSFPIIQSVTNRQVHLRDRDFYGAMQPAFISVLLMALAGAGYKFLSYSVFHWSLLVTFVLGVPLVGSVYLLSLYLLYRRHFQEMVQLVHLFKKNDHEKVNESGESQTALIS